MHPEQSRVVVLVSCSTLTLINWLHNKNNNSQKGFGSSGKTTSSMNKYQTRNQKCCRTTTEGFLFLLGQAKLTTLSRLVVWIRNLALCTAALFLIALMHHIVGTILSWLPNRSHSDQEFEGGDDRSHHHRDQDTLPQAPPAQDIVTLFHMVLMEVLDRVWEDLVMEEGQEQRPQALQVQALEALLPPLTYCKGGRDITSSCCSDRCTICLEDFVDGESCRVFACKHMFHSNCIDHWLKNHLTCPICRNSVVDI